jgi:hypothetical protein
MTLLLCCVIPQCPNTYDLRDLFYMTQISIASQVLMTAMTLKALNYLLTIIPLLLQTFTKNIQTSSKLIVSNNLYIFRA